MFGDSIEGFCAQCNRMSALEVRAEAHAVAPRLLLDQLDTGEDGLRNARYKIAFCPQCEAVFLHVRAESEPSEIPYEAMLYPTLGRREIAGLPESVRRTYASAQSCFETGNYEPCVLMCRKCLEALCVSLGVEGGPLASRLRRLKDSKRIEERLYEWAEGLRLVGNDAAHDMHTCISKQDALDSLDFVEAILLYAFALDQRFREFRDRRIQATKAKGPSNRAM